MTGTKLCNGCWEVERRFRDFLRAPKAQAYVAALLLGAVVESKGTTDELRTRAAESLKKLRNPFVLYDTGDQDWSVVEQSDAFAAADLVEELLALLGEPLPNLALEIIQRGLVPIELPAGHDVLIVET